MGNKEIIPRTAQPMGGKRQSSEALHRTNESKQLEATRKTQVAIQASKLLTSGLSFGLVGRDHRSSGGLWKHEMRTQDDKLFLEPKKMSHCQGHGSIACALRSGLLEN